MFNLFSNTRLTNYISSTGQVGFCQFGPTLTIGGVLSTAKSMYLINHISAGVTTPFKSFKKEFDWFSLQPYSAIESRFEIFRAPSKFTLPRNEPLNYNILFVDNDCYAQMKTVLLNISSAWQFLLEKNPKQPHQEIFSEFSSSPVSQEYDNMLKNLCYWKAGRYQIEFCIAAKDDVFIEKKSFELDEDAVVALQSNSTHIISSNCDQPSVSFKNVPIELA